MRRRFVAGIATFCVANSTGLGRFFIFRCVVRGDLVTCRNAFGDAMRYRPRDR
jgi:hypothetical protein